MKRYSDPITSRQFVVLLFNKNWVQDPPFLAFIVEGGPRVRARWVKPYVMGVHKQTTANDSLRPFRGGPPSGSDLPSFSLAAGQRA
jgi:hypothetical protein